MQRELKLAVKERDQLLKANVETKAELKLRLQQVTILQQGNAAVNKEINRMNEENTVLLDTHLNSKNVISNFANENEYDSKLIQELEE